MGLAGWMMESFQGQADAIKAAEKAYLKGYIDASGELVQLYLDDPRRL